MATKQASRARHANTVDDLSTMDSFERELMRATKEHHAAVLWGMAGVFFILSTISFSLAGYGIISLASGTASLILLGLMVLCLLLSIAPMRQIKKIDNRELEGAEEFFSAIRGSSLLP